MSQDLNDLLEGWSHEPGQIKVRKIMGSDGREKVQLRLDLGLIQMEMTGRPDGTRPKSCESLLSYHQGRAMAAEKKGEKYELSAFPIRLSQPRRMIEDDTHSSCYRSAI